MVFTDAQIAQFQAAWHADFSIDLSRSEAEFEMRRLLTFFIALQRSLYSRELSRLERAKRRDTMAP